MKKSRMGQLKLFDDIELNPKVIVKKTKIDESYIKKLLPIKVSPIYDLYWRFAHWRQLIFFRKLYNQTPLTDDPILSKYKFTNSYRASDRVSQYLIRNVIYKKKSNNLDTFYRIILFKLFNKIETWELLEKEFGEITFKNYNYEKYDHFFNSILSSRKRIYSAAYIMAPGKLLSGVTRKHSNHLKLLELMINDEVHEKITKLDRFQEVYDLLTRYPMIGPFLGYQFSIDLNYSEIINFSEDEFVIPGPGAQSGIAKCFEDTAGLSEIEIIRFMKDRQEFEFKRLELDFPSLWGRPLTLIDCQNIFCEVDKYSRIAFPNINGKNNRKKIKQIYKQNKQKINSYLYPPKWGINEVISERKI